MSSKDNGDQAPWKSLFRDTQEHVEQPAEQQQHQTPVQRDQPISELESQLLNCYYKTFAVAGFGLAGSVWRWHTFTKHNRPAVFVPPRAQALPAEMVQQWKKKAEFRDMVATTGRQTFFITCVAGLYFGVEAGVGLLRNQKGDWANTAAAGAVTGGWLGARVPSSMRGRTLALGALLGGLLGAASGWTQQQLTPWLEQEQQRQQQQQQQRQQQQESKQPPQ